MRIYDKLTESPETLGEFLKGLPVLDAPWDRAFQEKFCAGCSAESCDNCRNEQYRNNPDWWLGLDEDKKAAERLQRLLNTDFSEEEINIELSYAEKSTEIMGKEEFEKYLKSVRESCLKQIQNEGAAY